MEKMLEIINSLTEGHAFVEKRGYLWVIVPLQDDEQKCDLIELACNLYRACEREKSDDGMFLLYVEDFVVYVDVFCHFHRTLERKFGGCRSSHIWYLHEENASSVVPPFLFEQLGQTVH